MILADKIMHLRKKNGWSQEELAGKLGVSRQSVSKWESAVSIPELDKILQLSEIFEVSTDFLLKDDMVEEIYTPGNPAVGEEEAVLRKVTMEEAQAFLKLRLGSARKMAIGVAACILSPIPLILLPSLAEQQVLSASEESMTTIGLVFLLLAVAAAVANFIMLGMKLEKYEYLEKEDFQLAYGIEGMVKERCSAREHDFTMRIACGVVMCIVAVIPILITSILVQKPLAVLAAVVGLLVIVAAAVYLFVTVGMERGAYQQLLQIGEYTREGKAANKVVEQISAAYWCLVTAIYLAYSFWSGDWGRSWVVWPVAGVLFGAVAGVVHARPQNKKG